MSKLPTELAASEKMERFRAGAFVFTAEDDTVLVTKDTKTGVQIINFYTYPTHDIACDMAWKMACKQMRA